MVEHTKVIARRKWLEIEKKKEIRNNPIMWDRHAHYKVPPKNAH